MYSCDDAAFQLDGDRAQIHIRRLQSGTADIFKIPGGRTRASAVRSACDYNFGNDFYAIGFRKSDVELTNKVNDALQTLIDNGTAAKISKKWFGKDIVILEDYK